jgi:beta-N-acetylhexosaminidase
MNQTLRQQIGQLLIMGFDGTSLTPNLGAMLREVQPAGVILFARNVESGQQTHALLSSCRETLACAPFLCVDMEGGSVDRLKRFMGPAPSAASVFDSGNKSWFARHGELIGAECSALGFNTDFAPTLDLALPTSRSVLGSRAVSADPQQVAEYGGLFLAGLDDSGVLGCGKHFPGLGEATLDTHNEMPSVQKSFERMWAEDLAPFRILCGKLPLIMISHANYPSVTGDKLPASISPHWITEILRNRIGYRGLIVSDDLEMGAALAAGSIGETAIAAVGAGANLVLVCRREEMVREAWEALLQHAERNPGFAARVAEAAGQVEAFKNRAPQIREHSSFSVAAIEKQRLELAKFSAHLQEQSQKPSTS